MTDVDPAMVDPSGLVATACPNLSPIAFVAETYAAQGRTAEAADVLAGMDKLQAAPGVKAN